MLDTARSAALHEGRLAPLQLPDLHEGQIAQARGLLAQRLPAGIDEPAPEVVESWARCLAAGRDVGHRVRLDVVHDADLRRRRDAAGRVRTLALAELELLYQQIAGSNFLLAYADPDGIVLDRYLDQRFATSDTGEGIPLGSLWSEAAAGTNGLGTALAAGRPVAVSGPEHFFDQFGRISCTAAPIRDADGAVVGALDASSYYDSRQRHTQALVQMAAAHIENVLLAEQRAEHLVLAVHPRPEFVGTLSAGLLAFDGEGRLSAFNGRALGLLAGLPVARGVAFERLFGEPFERFLARLHRGDAWLRDVLGSVLATACMHAGGVALLARGPAPAVPAAVDGSAGDAAGDAAGKAAAEDPAAATARTLAEAAVRRTLPLLILGETGSGKELLARHAHTASGRGGAFVPVNCGAVPAELFEAELFGYAGGAFTGARRQGSEGLLAAAHGGTLLLDEIGELPPALQPVLLRFLDDGLVRPVGGRQSRRVDVQVLAATHVDLERAAAAGRFRADLLYRLATVQVRLPPLRARSDFAAVARSVLQGLDPQARLTQPALARLAAWHWPGNFRELRACLARALLLHPTGVLDAADVAAVLPEAAAAPPAASGLQQAATGAVLEAVRRGGSVSAAARALGISRTTVYRHLQEAGLHAPRVRGRRVA